MFLLIGTMVAINIFLVYNYVTKHDELLDKNTQTINNDTIKNWNKIKNKLIIKKLKNTLIKQRIDKVNNQKLDFYNWKTKISLVNNELLTIKAKLEHYNNMKKNLEIINSKCHYLYWNSLEQINKFKKFKCIVFDLNIFMENNNDYYINTEYLKLLQFLSLFSNENKIIFYLIGELHPKNIYQITNKLKYFNKNHYISPYNYTQSIFGNIKKLPLLKYTEKPVDVSVNRILDDISEFYNFNYKDLLYIGNLNTLQYQTVIVS